MLMFDGLFGLQLLFLGYCCRSDKVAPITIDNAI
jgi:hypothetical protein